MKKIKLCVITTISKTMDWFVCDSTRNLSKNGYDITLICNMDEGFAERNEYAQCIPIKMERGVTARDILPTILKLVKIFKKEKFDIVQYTTPNAALYASIASFIARVPIRLYSQWGIRYVSLKGYKKKIFKLVEKLTCMLSTDIREVSPMNRQLAIEEGLCSAEKISVIGRGGTIGVELSECDLVKKSEWRNELRRKFGIPQDAFVYGYVGRINADKGINKLIMAFKQIAKNDSKVFLMLVGMYDDSNPISDDMYKWAKQSPNVIFTGNVPTSEVYHYMGAFDVLTHPTYREGFGKVLQEAMGMQLPIITTNVPGPCEVIEANVSGLLVEARDAKQLEEAMKFVRENPDVCEKMSLEARRQAEQYYDRPIMLKNILNDMNELVRKGSKINGK